MCLDKGIKIFTNLAFQTVRITVPAESPEKITSLPKDVPGEKVKKKEKKVRRSSTEAKKTKATTPKAGVMKVFLDPPVKAGEGKGHRREQRVNLTPQDAAHVLKTGILPPHVTPNDSSPTPPVDEGGAASPSHSEAISEDADKARRDKVRALLSSQEGSGVGGLAEDDDVDGDGDEVRGGRGARLGVRGDKTANLAKGKRSRKSKVRKNFSPNDYFQHTYPIRRVGIR